MIKMTLGEKYGKRLAIYTVILFSILLILGNFKGIYHAKNWNSFQVENVSILQNYEQQSIDKLSRLCPFLSYEDAYTRIGKLKRNRLNVFSNTIYSYSEIPFSRLNGLINVELNHWLGFEPESFSWDNTFVNIPGAWVVDYINQKEYTQVYMKVNNKLYRTADHLYSPDVAEHFENTHYKNVRFAFSFPINGMSIGENRFSVVVILNDGLTYYETDTIKIYKNEAGGISLDVQNPTLLQNPALPEIIRENAEQPFHFLDFVNNQTVTNNVIHIVGWALDGLNESVASRVVIQVGDENFLADYGKARKDVAEYFQKPQYLNSGYHATLYKEDVLDAGGFTVHVISSDGTYMYEPQYFSVTDN